VDELDDGATRLCGELPDQAALHGVLAKIRDLGMTLIAVQLVEALPPDPQRFRHDFNYHRRTEK
jgi:hypothetical protein